MCESMLRLKPWQGWAVALMMRCTAICRIFLRCSASREGGRNFIAGAVGGGLGAFGGAVT